VNNARYLEFLEEARWALFDAKKGIMALANSGFAFNVVNINISYRRPAVLYDLLTIETSLEKVGQKSATLLQKIIEKNGGEVIADALVTFVLLDIQKKKAAPLEGQLKEKLIGSMDV
jgi:thioesterase-3